MSEKEERIPLIDHHHDPQSLSRSYPGTVGNVVTPSAPPAGQIDLAARAAPATNHHPATTSDAGYMSQYGGDAGYQNEMHVRMPHATPGAPQQQMDPPQVQNFAYKNSVTKVLILGVVGMIFFWPLAIVAFIFASQATNHFSAGKQVEGEKSAKIAKRLAIASIVIGAVSVVCVIGLAIIFSLAFILPATLSRH